MEPGMGVIIAPFFNFSAQKIFHFVQKIPVKFFEAFSYLTGETVAELKPAKYQRDIRYLITGLIMVTIAEISERGKLI